MLPGAERLACRDQEIAQAGLAERREIGGVDVERSLADRFDALLAQRYPVRVGQLFDGQLRCTIGKERSDSGLVGLGRLAWQPGFELPFLGLVLGYLAAGENYVEILVERVLVCNEGCLHDVARRECSDLPAHFATAVSLASRASSMRPARSE